MGRRARRWYGGLTLPLAFLDQCIRGKHEFGRHGYPEGFPKLNEFYQWKCRYCGAWMWRSEVTSYEVDVMRQAKNLTPWEKSKTEDFDARQKLKYRKDQLRGVASLFPAPGGQEQTPAGPAGVHSSGPKGVNSLGSQGVDSPRSRGVRSKRPTNKPRIRTRKAVRK